MWHCLSSYSASNSPSSNHHLQCPPTISISLKPRLSTMLSPSFPALFVLSVFFSNVMAKPTTWAFSTQADPKVIVENKGFTRKVAEILGKDRIKRAVKLDDDSILIDYRHSRHLTPGKHYIYEVDQNDKAAYKAYLDVMKKKVDAIKWTPDMRPHHDDFDASLIAFCIPIRLESIYNWREHSSREATLNPHYKDPRNMAESTWINPCLPRKCEGPLPMPRHQDAPQAGAVQETQVQNIN